MYGNDVQHRTEHSSKYMYKVTHKPCYSF